MESKNIVGPALFVILRSPSAKGSGHTTVRALGARDVTILLGTV
jgi:hypothetical protein